MLHHISLSTQPGSQSASNKSKTATRNKVIFRVKRDNPRDNFGEKQRNTTALATAHGCNHTCHHIALTAPVRVHTTSNNGFLRL